MKFAPQPPGAPGRPQPGQPQPGQPPGQSPSGRGQSPPPNHPATPQSPSGPPPGGFAHDDAVNNRGMAALCYIELLFLIPLLWGRDKSPFVKAHSEQGLILCLGSFAALLALSILAIIPGVNLAVIPLLAVLACAYVVFAVVKIVECLRGRFKPLWLIGGIKFFS